MMLSDISIRQQLRAGAIEISPAVRPEHIRPTGIRLHLGHEVLLPEPEFVVDLTAGPSPHFTSVRISDDHGFLVEPGQFLLATSVESIRVRPDLVCHLDGRSTLARMGLMVHCSSNVIDNNNDEARSVVLEIANCGPFTLRLRAGMPIGMLTFTCLSEPIGQPNQAQYRGQNGVVGPDLTFVATPAEQYSKATSHAPADYRCPFCQIADGGSSGLSAPDDVVYRDEFVTALIASHWWPNNAGSVVVISNGHFENIMSLPSQVGARIFDVSKMLCKAMKTAYGCPGTSLRQHNEPAGGQDVWHYHQHVFPRYDADRLYELTEQRYLAPLHAKQEFAALLRTALNS